MWINIIIQIKNERGTNTERKYYRIDSHNLDKALEQLQKFHWEYEDKLKIREEHSNKFVKNTVEVDRS